MDIGSATILKQSKNENKEILGKDKKISSNKQGCIKLNDYFSF